MYQSDPRTGTAFIVPSVINLTGTTGGTPSYHHGPSSLEGYNAPPPPSGYHGYDLAKGSGRGSLDNYSKGKDCLHNLYLIIKVSISPPSPL